MKIKFYTILLITSFFINTAYSVALDKVQIIIKIEDEIITNVDVVIEKNYLIALNNSLKEIPAKQINTLAKNSLIREKIKKTEIIKFFDLTKPDGYMDEIIKDLYLRLNLNNEKNFIKYLSKYDLKINNIKEKLKIETLWNRLIFEKYKKSLRIDKKNIENQLRNKIKKEAHNQEFNLSEIFFDLNLNEKIEEKTKLINKDIDNLGFENASTIYSKSNTAEFGGKIGWIKKSQLSKEIIEELKLVKEGNYSNPIKLDNGYLILKINKKKTTQKKIDFNKELEKHISIEKNKQLNQFSNIYFNKIKQNIFISEL